MLEAEEASVRVLIVDDNQGLAENIAEILDGEGYATDIAGSAEEALIMAQSECFGMLVTDFRLPGITGVDLIKSLRREGQHPHAVVISAFSDETTVGAAEEVGARFLSKPIDVRLLNHLLRSVELRG